MKKSSMYALTVAVLDVIAAYSVITSNIDPNVEAYKKAVSEAEAYESSGLYYNSILSYTEALKLNEDRDLRLKIAELYEKGYENGEISSLQGKYNMLDTVVQIYPEDTESYDMIIKYLSSAGDYSKCAEYVRSARSSGVSSDVITQCYDKLKSMYTAVNTVYSSVTDMGSCITAQRSIITETDKLDENGGIVYTEDENGEKIPEKEQRELTEYTFMYYDGSDPQIYTALNMSPPSLMKYSDGDTRSLVFCKDYGKEIASGELSREIYSRLESDGIRQCYIGEENEYEAFAPFSNSRLPLYNKLTGKYDMFGVSGKKLAEGYDRLGCFSDGFAYSEKDGVKTVINTDGTSVFSAAVSDVILGHGERCSYNKRMFVKFEGSTGYKMINSEDLSDMGFECDDADLFFGEAAAFGRNGKYGFVDQDGNVLIEPQYDDAKSFSNGYAAVKIDGKWGYINRYGEITAAPAYDEALYMNTDGEAFVCLGGTWMLLTLFYVE